MNWGNYGKHWEFDHTIPISIFNLKIKEDIIFCYNWMNIRPLRKDKNRSKSNKVNLREYLFQEIKSNYFLRSKIHYL